MAHKNFLWLPLIILFLVIFNSSVYSKREGPKTNLEVANELVSGIADELIAAFPPSVHKRGISVVPFAHDEPHQFVANGLIKAISSKGLKVFTASSSSAGMSRDSTGMASILPRAMNLKFQNVSFVVKYTKMFRSHLIGGKRVKRYADIMLFAQLIDPKDDSVVLAKEIGRSYGDKFPYSRIGEVEEGTFGFTKPNRLSTKWSRLIEPVVVSGIIVGLIYLFFSNQSGD